MGPPPLPKDKGEPRLGISRSYTPSQNMTATSSYMANPNQEKGNLTSTMGNSQEKSPPLASSSSQATGSSRAAANMSAPRQEMANPLAVQRERERQAEADAISDRLKLAYLRTQRPETAAYYLNMDGKLSKYLRNNGTLATAISISLT